MPAHYAAPIATFVESPIDSIVGQLTLKAAESGFVGQIHTQTLAWRTQIEILQRVFRALEVAGEQSDGHVLLEFPIPRRAKRIDTVILVAGIILVLEFKCGANRYSRESVEQVEDYCLDLSDFHRPSHGRTIVPIVVATAAEERPLPLLDTNRRVTACVAANADCLSDRIDSVRQRLNTAPIDALAWNHGEYTPTPTIIEAARHLYAGNNVREISRTHAGEINLTETTDAIIRTVERACRLRQKTICFVTGVPGAGKTLAGLNVVHNHELRTGDLGIFLTGNGPLVKVLTEALAQDHRCRNGGSIKESRRQVSTFIQNVHRFIDSYWENSIVPRDKVVIFDEAQRAWNRAQSERKFGRPHSESELLLRIMSRHDDWSVIIALVGGGQEINSGEAGLSEWGRTLVAEFPEWNIVISPLLKTGRYQDNDGLFVSAEEVSNLEQENALHLATSLRSYRAEGLSNWVSLFLQHDEQGARRAFDSLRDYPLYITRSLDKARQWLRHNQRGSRRAGIIASSGAKRLRADGIDLDAKIEVEHWFLKPHGDVRSSQCLESAATEFDIQGLEIDWACLAWGGDLVPNATDWEFRSFKGTKWQTVNDPIRQQFLLNKYRVLFTRAREGLIVYVPRGSDSDVTRPTERYECVATYCERCGVIPLD